jgi:hypothetical protein
LFEDNFLGDYLRKSPDLVNGYCNIDRVLLTILINQGEYVKTSNNESFSIPYEFYFLVRDMYLIYKDVDVVLSKAS